MSKKRELKTVTKRELNGIQHVIKDSPQVRKMMKDLFPEPTKEQLATSLDHANKTGIEILARLMKTEDNYKILAQKYANARITIRQLSREIAAIEYNHERGK